MADTFTTQLGLTKPEVGANKNTWGSLLNSGVFDLVDSAISGVTEVDVSVSTTINLTASDGSSDQSRSRVLKFTGTPDGDVTVAWPSRSGFWIVDNDVAGSNKIILTGASTGTFDVSTNSPGYGLYYQDAGGNLNNLASSFIGDIVASNSGLTQDSSFDLSIDLADANFLELTASGLDIVDSPQVETELTIEHTTDSADLVLHRNDATPSDDDVVGRVIFRGEDFNFGTADYAAISGISNDVTATTEDGSLVVSHIVAGTSTTHSVFDSVGLTLSQEGNTFNIQLGSETVAVSDWIQYEKTSTGSTSALTRSMPAEVMALCDAMRVTIYGVAHNNSSGAGAELNLVSSAGGRYQSFDWNYFGHREGSTISDSGTGTSVVEMTPSGGAGVGPSSDDSFVATFEVWDISQYTADYRVFGHTAYESDNGNQTFTHFNGKVTSATLDGVRGYRFKFDDSTTISSIKTVMDIRLK